LAEVLFAFGSASRVSHGSRERLKAVIELSMSGNQPGNYRLKK